jgi:hypothetical protein
MLTTIALGLLLAKAGDGGRVLVDDPLKGGTRGVLEGPGEFVTGGGFRSRGGRIVYDAGRAIERGTFEATMRGVSYRSRLQRL